MWYDNTTMVLFLQSRKKDTALINTRHHAIFYPSVKFSILKLLWYGKNIICVFANHECIQKQKQNNTKHLGQQVDKHTTSMRWTQVIAGMSYSDWMCGVIAQMPHIRRRWSHGCKTFLRPLAVNGRYWLRPSHGRRTFSCDKCYISRKLVSQVWPKIQLVRFICVQLRQLVATIRN